MKKLTFFILFAATLCLSFTFNRKEKVFTLKKFEKNNLGLVKSNLYAGKYEVSHLEYIEFLNHLEKTEQTEKLAVASIQNENWKDLLPNKNYNSPFVEVYHSHPAYFEYPVVNVSHEGANLFCEWLTDIYHQNPERKFSKVRFRLPTKEEWILAAKGGHELAPFPWGGYYTQNGDGDILANFYRIPQSALKAKHTPNGLEVELAEPSFSNQLINSQAHITAPVKSFLPNDFGLHNMSGNVAEMLAEKGSTKGGSWRSSAYYIRIDAEDEFAGWEKPSPLIGFRYFMEVIEE